MSSHSHNSRGHVAVMLLAMIALLCSVGMLAAQDSPAPKWELYGGYSAFNPGCDLNGLLPGGTVPVSSCVKWDPRGLGASVTYDFNRWFGLSVDSSGQWGSGNSGIAARIDQVEFFNLSAGPKITYRTHYFSPFLEALLGEHRLASEVFGNDHEFGFMTGGGLDLNLPFTLGAAWAVVLADVVQDLEYQIRPFETKPGETTRAAKDAVEILYRALLQRPRRGRKWGSLAWHLATPYFEIHIIENLPRAIPRAKVLNRERRLGHALSSESLKDLPLPK